MNVAPPAPEALLRLVEALLSELRADAPTAQQITLDSSLDRDLGLDSLARLELLARTERAFGVELPEDTLQAVQSVRDLLDAVLRCTGGGGAMTAPARAAIGTAEPATEVPVTAGESTVGAPDTARTLPEVLAWHLRAHPDRLQVTCLVDEREQRISYRQLAERAAALAAGLQRAGVRPRQTVALMLPTSPEYFHTWLGILIAGCIPVPIYPPARPAQLEEHVLRHAGILDNAQAAMLVGLPETTLVARLLQARVPSLRHVVTPAQLSAGVGPGPPTAVAIAGDDIAFLQYTSGSTGKPKGVALTHANLLANIRAMARAIAASPDDVFVSWLPLYHDMGLIGAWLGSLYVGMPLVVMSPLAFLARPQRWLWAIHRYRGTLSAGPNFAFELCAGRLDDAVLDGLDLGSWRLAFNGAEPVSPDTVLRFQQRFARYGLRPTALAPVYGLAESSVGLLFPPPDRGPVIDAIEREALTRGGRAVPAAPDDRAALRFVACGRPLPGHAIRIVDEAGVEVGERIEGRLEFKGPSATKGYFRNPEATARLFDDGWLDTGDRAYRANGDVYVTGRVKDIVIRAGRNLYPQAIEEAVGKVVGVRKGCIAVFGGADPRAGTERLVVMAETRMSAPAPRERLRNEIRNAVLATIGEPCDEVVLVPPHAVRKTSSGKVRRSACRALYEAGDLGAQPRSATHQAIRLAVGALAPGLSHGADVAGRTLFALYARTLFWVLAPASGVLALAMPGPAAAWSVCHRSARLLFRLTGMPLNVNGLANIPRAGACVLVSNHASYLDGIALVAALPQPVGFVAKRELRSRFLVRRFLAKLDTEFVERADPKDGVDDAGRLAQAVAAGKSLVVFPEGTFADKPGLLPFRLGAFLAAARAGVPVVPVGIRGTREILPGESRWPRRGVIDIDVLAPVGPEPADADLFATAVKLREAVFAAIARLDDPGTG